MFLNAINNQSTDFALFAFENRPTMTAWDEDWVEMEFHIKMDDHEYHVTDACLTALEIFRLAKWMRDIATGVAVEKTISFLEPNLSFELNYDYGKTKIIKIMYDAELRPSWHKEPGPYYQYCHCGNRQLIKISATLMAELNDLYSKAGWKMEDGSWKTENKTPLNLSPLPASRFQHPSSNSNL